MQEKREKSTTVRNEGGSRFACIEMKTDRENGRRQWVFSVTETCVKLIMVILR